jgi:hypothetical protein
MLPLSKITPFGGNNFANFLLYCLIMLLFGLFTS